MLLITERVIRTNGPLRREDPAPHGNLDQVPDLFAGDVRSSQFLFVFQESELPLLTGDIEQRTSRARAGDRHIFEYVRSQQKPEQDWKCATLRFPVIRGQESFVHCYWPTKQPVNFIGVTNIPLGELLKHPLKQGGECIGNHCIQKFYDELVTYTARYVDNMGSSNSDPKKLSIVLARFRSYWESFVLESKGNDYFNPKLAEDALAKLSSIQERVKIELEAEKHKTPFYKSWWFEKVVIPIVIAILVAYIIYRLGW